jgi:hypothetical protein
LKSLSTVVWIVSADRLSMNYEPHLQILNCRHKFPNHFYSRKRKTLLHTLPLPRIIFGIRFVAEVGNGWVGIITCIQCSCFLGLSLAIDRIDEFSFVFFRLFALSMMFICKQSLLSLVCAAASAGCRGMIRAVTGLYDNSPSITIPISRSITTGVSHDWYYLYDM